VALKDIFLNRHAEIRSGWRIVIFLLALAALLFLVSIPLSYLGVTVGLLGPVLVLACSLAASYVATRFINRKPFTAIGLSLHPATFLEFGTGCLLGFLMMTGIFIVQYLLGFATLTSRGLSLQDSAWVLLSSIPFFGVAALTEEVIFRGYVFQTLIQAITILPAVFVMAVVFALVHLANPNTSTLGVINVGFAAILLSFAYLKTRSLWLPFGLHFAWNYSQTTLYSFPTSGLEFAGRRLFQSTHTGPEWLTGGLFGPEGGLLATAALIACTWYILKTRRLTVPEGIITLDSVEDLLKPESLSGDGTG
jgi:hypothetical protein